ncbi:MAG: branched-chain amino acid ABC transporter permease [Pararhodobacter sp.]|nr:branched-chain amino acid ABC transporter permease [Pararhodobacter sp.]
MRLLPALRGVLPDAALLLLAVAAFYLFPYDLAFLTRIVIMAIFVLSIDLILGLGGIVTLGQAAFYGTGAYVAGIFALHVSNDPVLGLVLGMAAGAAIALISGLLLMRANGLTLIMLSIGVAQVLHEIANRARDVTGGADGMPGIRMGPVLGLWQFDFIGRTGYIYCVVVLFVLLFALKILKASPFGLMVRGIHENPARMRAIGTPVYFRLLVLYTLGGGVAGIAGALTAQITQLVSLEVFSFTLSAEAVIMLILGGMGKLYGAIIGTLLFMIVHHLAASIDPVNWLFLIGLMVLVVVFFLPRGLLGLPAALHRMVRGPK